MSVIEARFCRACNTSFFVERKRQKTMRRRCPNCGGSVPTPNEKVRPPKGAVR